MVVVLINGKHEERRMTLETLLHDEERYQETLHDVPSLQEANHMIARSEEEVELFDQMDEDLDWIEEMTRYDQVPEWLRAGSREVNTTIAKLSKKPSKKRLVGDDIDVESTEMVSDLSTTKSGWKRVRSKGPFGSDKAPKYSELDDENGEFSEASSERRKDSLQEEEVEVGEFEDEEFSGAAGAPAIKDKLRDEGLVYDSGSEYPQARKGSKTVIYPRRLDLLVLPQGVEGWFQWYLHPYLHRSLDLFLRWKLGQVLFQRGCPMN